MVASSRACAIPKLLLAVLCTPCVVEDSLAEFTEAELRVTAQEIYSCLGETLALQKVLDSFTTAEQKPYLLKALNTTAFGEATSLQYSNATYYDLIGYILRLKATDIQVNVSIPTEIGQLQFIMGVHLERVDLFTFPTEIGCLSTLRSISFRESSLRCGFPTEVGRLRALENLELYSRDRENASNVFEARGQLPTELGSLTSLHRLALWRTLFGGIIPSELGRLQRLRVLELVNVGLQGELPTELGLIGNLQAIRLSTNRLTGSIPRSLFLLREVTHLDLHANFFQGTLPVNIGRLPECLSINLASNQLQGALPFEIDSAPRSNLHQLALSSNNMSGTISSSICRLANMKSFTTSFNELAGTIPSEIGALANLESMHLSRDRLVGMIPTEFGRLQGLKELSLRDNFLKGVLPSEIAFATNAKALAFSNNRLVGTLPTEMCAFVKLKVLALDTNLFKGQLPSEIAKLKNIAELYLHRNKFVGPIPPQMFNLETTLPLQVLTLHSNHLRGALPPLSTLKYLRAITLHGNRFSGDLKRLSPSPTSLGLITLHRNRFNGRLPAFRLVPWYSDSNFYRDENGRECFQQSLQDCQDPKVSASCQKHCSKTLRIPESSSQIPPLITLYKNVLSCKLPQSISDRSDTVKSIVLMGNLFDDPDADEVDWVSEHESSVAFLSNSKETWLSSTHRIAKPFVAALVLFVVFRYAMGRVAMDIVRAAFLSNDDSVVLLHRMVLVDFSPVVVIATFAILPLCIVCSRGYYTCGHWWSYLTMTYFGGWPFMEVLATFALISWSCVAVCFAARVTDGPATVSRLKTMRSRNTVAYLPVASVKPSIPLRIVGWCLWLGLLWLLSIPSLIFCVTATLPDNNTLFEGLGRAWVRILYSMHHLTPFLSMVLNQMCLQVVTTTFAKVTGAPPINLVMQVWTSSTWVLVTISVLMLHENCAGKWKVLWSFCETDKFDVKLGPMDILSTRKDICYSTFLDIFADDRCPRTVIDTLHPLFANHVAAWSLLIPFNFLMKRSFGRNCYEPERSPSLSKFKRTTDVAFLARVIEINLAWGAVMPSLAIIGAFAIMTHAVISQTRVYDKGALLAEEDELRLSSLRRHLLVSAVLGLGMQVWFAFATLMHGRYILVCSFLGLLISRAWFKVDVGASISSYWNRFFLALCRFFSSCVPCLRSTDKSSGLRKSLQADGIELERFSRADGKATARSAAMIELDNLVALHANLHCPR